VASSAVRVKPLRTAAARSVKRRTAGAEERVEGTSPIELELELELGSRTTTEFEFEFEFEFDGGSSAGARDRPRVQ
jgi:hypothetical protein